MTCSTRAHPIRVGFAIVAWSLVSTSLRAEDTRSFDLGDGVTLELVRVPKGKFTQGSPATEVGRNRDETAHQVTLTREFLLGKYPVTVRQFKQFVAETRFRTEAEKGESGGFGFDGSKLIQRKEFNWRNPGFPQTDDHPVTIVTYDDALAFTRWLSSKSGLECGLPTEAMWEYACRGGTRTPWPGINNEKQVGEIAWHKGNAGNGTRPVGQKNPNAFGLYDMCGNVYEWCRDWYGPYGAGDETDPVVIIARAGDSPRRVLRGGSWLKDAAGCRAAARYRNSPGSRNADNGFRVMLVERPSRSAAPGPPLEPPRAPEPPRPAEPPPITPGQPSVHYEYESSSPTFFRWTCLCFVLPLLAVVAVAFVIIRRLTRAPGVSVMPGAPARASQAPQPQVRIGEDGFWVEGPGVRPGMSVRYRCRVSGSEQQGGVAITSTSQFVYTGGTPSSVEIIEIRPGPGRPMGGTTYRSGPIITGPGFTTSVRRPATPPPSQPLRTDDEPFSGYPSAY